MNIFNSYKRSRFFLWVNITGLAIGLAASILLILFVIAVLTISGVSLRVLSQNPVNALKTE